MDELLEEVLRLQPDWTSKNTPAMVQRGILIRRTIADWLRSRLPILSNAVADPVGDLAIQGRDATGPKSEIPWVRIYSRSRSPSATQGWYVVYLFNAVGDVVFLSLNQGTTIWDGEDYVSRPPEELQPRVSWARSLLADQLAHRPDLVGDITLAARRSDLGPQYELGNVAAIAYPRGSVPAPAVLEADAVYMTALLGHLYRAETESAVPGVLAPELADLLDDADEASGVTTPPARKGFRLSTAEKVAIETHAVIVATEYYEAGGWTVTPYGKPFDLHLERGTEERRVEVKGTTSRGEQVALTRNEVDKQREYYPNNALVVVRGIELDRSTDPPSVAGGELIETTPWEIGDDDLVVVSYLYRTTLT